MMRYFVYLGFVVFFTVGCDTAKKQQQAVDSEKSEVESMRVQQAIIGEAPESNPTTKIDSVAIDGDVMVLFVEYSGGCEKQFFDLVGDEVVMKSFPPQRKIELVRNDQGDRCRELITERLMFDISSLKFQSSGSNGGEIILHLEGWDSPIRYTYD